MKRCEATIRSGTQCRNKTNSGNKFCHIHSTLIEPSIIKSDNWLKRYSKKILAVFAFICSIVGLIGFYLYLQDKKQNTTSGIITHYKNTSKKIVQIGGARFFINTENGIFIKDKNEPFVSFKIINGKLLVSSSIKNKKGELIAELKDNVWTHQVKPFIFDRNYNNHSLEIRDNTGKIVLQVVDFGYAIHLAGIFRCRNGNTVALIPTNDGGKMSRFAPNQEPKDEIKPICKYPSDFNLGSCSDIAELEKLYSPSQEETGYTFGSGEGLEVCGSVD